MLVTSIFLPLLSVIVLMFFKNTKTSKTMSLIRFLITFIPALVIVAISRYFYLEFNPLSSDFQFVNNLTISASYGLNWSFGLDGINLALFILTTTIFPIIIAYTYIRITSYSAKGQAPVKETLLYASLACLETCILAAFLTKNLIVFYIFWELLLFPMLILIGIWGGVNRKAANLKFFLYTFAGSAFLILGIVAFAVLQHTPNLTFDIDVLLEIINQKQTTLWFQEALFWAFIISFLVKIPVFPFHSWLPTAYVESPAVAVVASSILLKLGSYGIMRFSLPFFPEECIRFSTLFMSLGVFGILYGALLAWVQTDIKKVIAYSSISHMSYIVVGLFAGSLEALSGAYIQMINHTISISLLFILVSMLYDRTKSSNIEFYGGLAKLSPALNCIFLIALLSSVGLPGTNGFVGEFLILLGAFKMYPILTGVAVTGVIFSAVYMFVLYKKVFMGEPSEKLKVLNENLKLQKREILVISPLIVAIFLFGLKPSIILHPAEASLKKIIDRTQLVKEQEDFKHIQNKQEHIIIQK